MINPIKQYKSKELRRVSKRVLKIIDSNASRFNAEIREIAMSASTGIELGEIPPNHNCNEIQKAVKEIKLCIKERKILRNKLGTYSNQAIVPYYPGDYKQPDSKDHVVFKKLQDGQLYPFTQKYADFIEFDSDNYSDASSSSYDETRERRKAYVRRTSSPKTPEEEIKDKVMITGIKTEKKDEEEKKEDPRDIMRKLMSEIREKAEREVIANKKLERVIGHWYRFMEPRFKCRWIGPYPDSVLSTAQVINYPKEVKKYLLGLGTKSFNTLTHRAPRLWETVWDTAEGQE